VIGVDLGGTKILAGAVDDALQVHHRTRRLIFGYDQPALLRGLADAVAETIDAVGGAVAAVGFGIPCTFDRRTGMAVQAVNSSLRDVAFRDVMSERLGLPVVVDNDGNCSVLAEARHGAARGASDVVMLTLGTGIGSGIVIGGRLIRGSIGAGAEIGHMVVDMDGHRCQANCPNRGCLESVASGTALAREAREFAAGMPGSALHGLLVAGREIPGALVTELAHDGDPPALAAVEKVGTALGVGLANVVNVLNPDVIVVGGGVIANGERLLAPARREMLARALSPAKEHVRVVAAAFGEEAGMIGAALMAREEALPR
jgi:glucokinase